MNLSPEEKTIGRDNYYDALEVSRRDFFKEVIGAGVASTATLGAMYFGYGRVDNPVRVGVIGTGDEGNVLLGAMNPNYLQVVAISDIRPSSIHRAFHGDWASEAAIAARPGLMKVYGWKTEDEARTHVKVYERYEELLADDQIEAVVIALPLHLHAPAAILAMKHGKHVLTEKLMAHNIAQCKLMGRVATEKNLYLATGHQRHYNVLYDNAVNLLRWGVLGEVHYIRAQWHRGNLPGRDSWALPIPGGEKGTDLSGKERTLDPISSQLKELEKDLKSSTSPVARELLQKKIAQWKAWNDDRRIAADQFGYEERTLPNGRLRTAMEELVRWRLWERTGGGLMAELGSHQLDAATIFINALRADGKHVHPLTVHAVGGRHTFPLDRDSFDHVYCTFEFPGPGYDPKFPVGYYDPASVYPDPKIGVPSFDQDENKKIVVTYSSINGNGFGGYGEVVMGTRGTLVLERELETMLYKDSSVSTRVGVRQDGGGPTLDTQASGDGGPLAKAAEGKPVSRGYREQLEHWAWCIRNQAPENRPKCHPEVAIGDAVIATTARVAMSNAQKNVGGYLPFQADWFDMNHDATPDGSNISDERTKLDAAS